MKGRKHKKYYYMIVGDIGLLLLGLAVMRFLVVFDDTLGYGLVLFGMIFVAIYLGYLQKKIEISKKESIISVSAFVIIFFVLTVLFFF